MKTAARIGINYFDFLKITPRILNIYANAHVENKNHEQKTSKYQAYLISRWVWQKKIDIEKILNTEKQKQVMIDDQMLAQVKSLNAMFGGEEILDKNGNVV